MLTDGAVGLRLRRSTLTRTFDQSLATSQDKPHNEYVCVSNLSSVSKRSAVRRKAVSHTGSLRNRSTRIPSAKACQHTSQLRARIKLLDACGAKIRPSPHGSSHLPTAQARLTNLAVCRKLRQDRQLVERLSRLRVSVLLLLCARGPHLRGVAA